MSLSHTDPTSDYISIIDIALKVVDFQKEDGACLFFFCACRSCARPPGEEQGIRGGLGGGGGVAFVGGGCTQL